MFCSPCQSASFCFSCCLSRYRSLSFSFFLLFFFLYNQLLFRAQKLSKNNEMVPQRMTFWCFVKRADCSLASDSILFFLFFQSIPMLLIAISAGMNFSLLVPNWDRLCIERCVFSFLSLVLDQLNYLNYLKVDARYTMW